MLRHKFMGDHHFSIGSLSTFTPKFEGTSLDFRSASRICCGCTSSAASCLISWSNSWNEDLPCNHCERIHGFGRILHKNSLEKNSTHSTNFQLPTPSPIVASLLVASCPIVPPSSTFPRSSTWDPRFPNHWRSWQQLCSLPNGEPERKDRQKNRLFCKGPKKIWHTNPKSIALL